VTCHRFGSRRPVAVVPATFPLSASCLSHDGCDRCKSFGVRWPVTALVVGDLSPSSLQHSPLSASCLSHDGCDRSQMTKALTGQRTPKVVSALQRVLKW